MTSSDSVPEASEIMHYFFFFWSGNYALLEQRMRETMKQITFDMDNAYI